MKHVIFAITSGCMMVIICLIVMTVHGRDIRQAELEEALTQSAKQALEGAMVNGDLTICDRKALTAAFMQLFLSRIKGEEDPNRKVCVDVVKADVEKGLLSVRAKEWYTHPNGKKGVCEAKATYILEKESHKKTYSITYYIPWDIAKELGLDYVKGEHTVYRRFEVSEGKKIKNPGPAADTKERTFVCWQAVDGIAIGSVARSDVNYIAIYR
jgi:hypothetical protein